MSLLKNLSIFNKNNNKQTELKKDTVKKFLRLFFWILLIFVVFKSIVGSFVEKEDDFIMPEIKLEEQGPASTAASFVKEYLTYEKVVTGEQEKDYKDRVYTFGLENIKFPSLSTVKESAKVMNVFVFDIEKINDNQYDVLVKADVQYESLQSSVYLKVPVAEKDGKYAVEDTPVIIPAPEKANIEYIKYSQGEELYITESNKVKEIMENFFNTYCSGKPTEIAYYMNDGKPVKGFEGRFTFLYMREFHVFDLKDNNKYKATALIELKDSVSEKVFFQNYNIDLVQREGRWYVEKLNIRGGNINEKSEITEQK